MSTFTLTTGFPVSVHIKKYLDLRHERGELTTALAVYNHLRACAGHYRIQAKDQAYQLILSDWSEPYRAEIDLIFAYILQNDEEYWNDSLEAIYPAIQRLLDLHLVVSRKRKLSLLRAA